LDCAGSFIVHISIEKDGKNSIEARELLMMILEPLLGDVTYGEFTCALSAYMHYCTYMGEAATQDPNIRRFLDEVTKKWKLPKTDDKES